MKDITAPAMVEIQIRHDSKVIWVNVDGVCALRCCQIGELTVHDDRPATIRAQDRIPE